MAKYEVTFTYSYEVEAESEEDAINQGAADLEAETGQSGYGDVEVEEVEEPPAGAVAWYGGSWHDNEGRAI